MNVDVVAIYVVLFCSFGQSDIFLKNYPLFLVDFTKWDHLQNENLIHFLIRKLFTQVINQERSWVIFSYDNIKLEVFF